MKGLVMDQVKLAVRWIDKDGKEHRKEYDDEPTARKARDWVLVNGAVSADIAVIKTVNKTLA